MGHAILERVRLFGTRSADYIRASGHNGCIATEVTLQATECGATTTVGQCRRADLVPAVASRRESGVSTAVSICLGHCLAHPVGGLHGRMRRFHRRAGGPRPRHRSPGLRPHRDRIAGRFPHATWRSPDGPRPVVLAHAEVVIGAGAQTLQDARKPMHTSSTVLLRT
jgi:hypothetical protein